MGEVRHTFKRDNKTVTLVAVNMTSPFNTSPEIDNFAIVEYEDGRRESFFPDRSQHLHGLSVEEYKVSRQRGLFAVVTHAEVMKCNMELIAMMQEMQS